MNPWIITLNSVFIAQITTIKVYSFFPKIKNILQANKKIKDAQTKHIKPSKYKPKWK